MSSGSSSERASNMLSLSQIELIEEESWQKSKPVRIQRALVRHNPVASIAAPRAKAPGRQSNLTAIAGMTNARASSEGPEHREKFQNIIPLPSG